MFALNFLGFAFTYLMILYREVSLISTPPICTILPVVLQKLFKDRDFLSLGLVKQQLQKFETRILYEL